MFPRGIRWLGPHVRRWLVPVESVPEPTPPIRGVDTSTVGFLGETERGPTAPRLVTSAADFERWYGGSHQFAPGGTHEGSYLPYAVEGFFVNGGRRCYVGRIAGTDAVASLDLPGASDDLDPGPAFPLSVAAAGPGPWGGRVAVRVRDASVATADAATYRLEVRYWREDADVGGVEAAASDPDVVPPAPDVEEVFDDLSPVSGTPNHDAEVVGERSALVDLERTDGTRPANTDGWRFLAAPDSAPVSARDYEGSSATAGGAGEGSGLAAFETIDEISLVCVPDQARTDASHADLTDRVVAHCERLGDRVAVLGSPPTLDHANPIPPLDSAFAATYTPWLDVVDPSTHATVSVPPSGHVAGIYARSDATRGVHHAPANLAVRGVVGLSRPVSAADQSRLNPVGINAIRQFPGRGIRVWGARTLSVDTERRYVNVQRLLLHTEESVLEGLEWVGDEPNGSALWTRVEGSVENFLTTRWRDGALQGTTPEEAFFVRCDRSTMTQDDVREGRLVVELGVAPLKPAEFVVLRLERATAGGA